MCRACLVFPQGMSKQFAGNLLLLFSLVIASYSAVVVLPM